MKLASVIAKLPIVSINEGEQVAIVKNLFFNRKTKKLEYLTVVENAEDVIPAILSFKDLTGIGNDFITILSIDNIKKIQANETALPVDDCISLGGRTVLSSSGNVIGEIADYEINKKTGTVSRLLISDKTEVAGDTLVTLSPKFIVVSVPDAESKADSSLDDASVSYLVGKTLTADVTSDDETFTIQKGTVLTKELVMAAEENGVLLKLTMAV